MGLSISEKIKLVGTVLILLLALYPQFISWMNDGTNGTYFVSNYDEPAYSAYVNALIEGRPRKFDPFLQTPSNAESLYSIQMVPAYAIALPARLLGISVSTAFILLIALVAIASYLAVTKLLSDVTGNDTVSAAAGLMVLCLGTAVAFQGELRHLVTGSVLLDFLPFLRRYQPGFAFPIFFVFALAFYRSLFRPVRRQGWAAVAGILFAILVFSYFYLWTAAAAWAMLLAVLAIIFAKQERSNAVRSLAITGVIAAAALIPYFVMLADRASDLDAVQLLTRTRSPMFASPVLVVGIILGVAALLIARSKGIAFSDSRLLLLLSFAFLPAILLNQQVVTGILLQPVHYEIFICNYLALVAASILVISFIGTGPSSNETAKKLSVMVVAAATVWGFVEVSGATARASAAAFIRDGSMPALELVARQTKGKDAIVAAGNFVTADITPSVGSLRPLWNAHLSSAGGISIAENKRLFYLYLYFGGYGPDDLGEALRTRSFETTAAIFGSDRALPELAGPVGQITSAEIAEETAKYRAFVNALTKETATVPTLSYVIVPEKEEGDLTNLDRWYQRDGGTDAGLFRVYKLELR